MKKIILFILTICIGALLESCSKNSFQGRSYHLNIQFIDSKGNDLTNGIKYKDSELYPKHYLIDKSEYIVNSPTDQIHIGGLLLQINPNSNQKIGLTAHTPPETFKYTPHEIVIQLICEKIFGDNKQHEIVTRWTYEKTNSPKCESFSIDGGEQLPITLNEDGYKFDVKITIER